MMDNEQERNEHFQGFAELLYQELSELEGSHETLISEYRNKYDKQAIVNLLAQRACDLVYHAIEFLRYSPYIRPMQLTSTDTWVDIIPDLTEWPKPR